VVSVADLSSSAEKLERRGRNAGQDYATGVESVSDSDQASATLEAVDSWEQGIRDAISEGRFQSGVNNPTQSWQQQALEVGQSRFQEGVGNAGDAWNSGFSPFASELESLSLPPRGPRGSEGNLDRANQVARRLNEVRDEI
jgi:hypothetical protein